MPGRFLRTMLLSAPTPEPEAFTACPVVLAHPGADAWTPLATSLPFFRDLTAVETGVAVLEGCGHLPVERPGVDQLRAVLTAALARAASSA